jgi:hypothetical protein
LSYLHFSFENCKKNAWNWNTFLSRQTNNDEIMDV